MARRDSEENPPDVDIANEAIELVRQEVNKWEDATAWVTDKVAFRMRDLIRQLRKNYWGVYDHPVDPTTGRKKIWVPLTQSLCDAAIKTSDLDQKDVNVRAKKSESIPTAALLRAVVKDYLDEMYFGEHLDMLTRDIAIDGTAVWKTIEIDGKPKKTKVDLLNCYIDPTEENIQTAFRFTERSLSTADEMRAMDGWVNTDNLTPTTVLSRNDRNSNITESSASKFIDVYELWGKIPLHLITGDKNDKELVEGHVVVSGLEGKPTFHLAEKNLKKIKPYEEAWYIKVSGRWYGMGIAEKVLMLQLWLNTIVNIRINRSYVSQLGLFLIKRGAGITPQMISRLGANGGLLVNNTDDIQQLVMQEASQSSYQDEQNIVGWARQVTSAFEVVTGEQLPSSTTATAVATQQTGALSQFSMIKEGIGIFLQRWLDRHCIPVLAKNLQVEDIVRIGGEDITMDMAERVAAYMAALEFENALEKGLVPSEEELLMFMQQAQEMVARQPGLFIETVQKLVADDVEAKVFVTTEEINPAVIVTNLINMMNIVQQTQPELVAPTVKQIYDLLGLPMPRVPAMRPQQVPVDYQSQNSPTTPQQQLTKSTTFDNAERVQY